MVLPTHMRLRGYKCFDYLYKEGIRYYGSCMVLRTARSRPFLEKERSSNRDCIKCAISISNKVSKKAVTRNKLRRLFHEHLRQRLACSLEKKSMWAFITLKPNCIKEDSSKLLSECDKLLFKARLLS
mgnify:CR=1 FL=1